jgi:hypothetical protein
VGRVLCTAVFLVASCAFIFSTTRPATAQASNDTAQLKVGGAVSTPLTLTVADLKKMPRTTLHVENPHDKKSEVYEGVLLEELVPRCS